MTIPRIYLPQCIVVNTTITLDRDTSHHLLNVLRLRCGDELILFNGCGQGQEQRGEFRAQLIRIEKKLAVIAVGGSDAHTCGIPESPLALHLAQGVIGGTKMDYVVQKAVELGVKSITPLFMEFGNVKLNAERLQQRVDHWQKIALHASEQCGRCYVPKVLMAQQLHEWLATMPVATSVVESKLKVTLHPHSSSSLVALSEVSAGNEKDVVLLVGVEGGLSPTEIVLVRQYGFIGCHLGPRILRADTAAVVALSILQAQYGDIS